MRFGLLAVTMFFVGCGFSAPVEVYDAGGDGSSQAVADAGGDGEGDAGTEAEDAGTQISIGTDGGSDAGTIEPPPDSRPAPDGGVDPCSPDAGFETGTRFRTLMSAGGLRWYQLRVPPSYTPSPRMLVLNFHGYSSDPTQQALLSRMDPHADQRGFIVAYPAGINRAWNAGQCCGDPAWVTKIDDVRFASELIDAIAREYCIDPKRVYSTGMSNGGFFSHRLACELSTRIAAVAPVAGVLGIPNCDPQRRVPVLHIHGTEDLLVPYYGGGTLGFTSAPLTHAGWKVRNGCSTLLDQVAYQNGDARCLRASHCDDGADTELCTITGGGHTWPGGTPIPSLGTTSTDLDATARMLDFFEAHPLP